MRTISAPIFLAAFLFLPLQAGAQDEPTCEDYRCEFQARLEAECSCDTAENHGQYVRCVAHLVKDLVGEGLPTRCKGKLKRCAARSVCGKQELGFATCTTATYGTCVAPMGQPGTCENDPTLACSVDADCGVVSSRCRITRDPEGCVLAGGAVNLAPTCCANCTTAP